MKAIKKQVFCLVFFVPSFMFACKQEKEIKDQMNEKYTICYRAIDNRDTSWLKIDTSGVQTIGTFDFHYPNEKRHYKGQFKGAMYGDTLKGHYDFKVNNVDKWYRNPVAFLKRDGKLIMGVGQFSLIWGSGFFDNTVPIDYDKGRFIFEQVNCKP